MRVLVDVMGGDNAPKAMIDGVVQLIRAGTADDLDLGLIGKPEIIDQHLTEGDLSSPVRVVEAEQVISSQERPVKAFRGKPRSSLALGLKRVSEGEEEAFVSAGSTGALMAGGLLTFGRIPGVDRPAIASPLPNMEGGVFLMLDLGAHMDASAENLFQYAMMGSIYAQEILDLDRPRVALLNVGVEETKGSEVTRRAFRRLQASSLNFVGNLESRELFRGKADVVVCNGFAGNIALKLAEGMAADLLKMFKDRIGRSFLERIGASLLRGAFRDVAETLDYTEYGGAPLLGIDGICVKCHGSSDAKAMKNGILVAREVVEKKLLDKIGSNLRLEAEKSE